MKNQLIFFGQDRDDPSEPRWQRIRPSDRTELVYRVVNPPRIEPGDQDPDRVATLISQHLEQSPGIMLLLKGQQNGRTVVRVQQHKSKPISPGSVLLLSLDSGERWLSLEDTREFEIAPHECLIVPVTRDLRKRLEQFVERLDDLPEDYRQSMLFNLVLPTFESRIARLEQIEMFASGFKPLADTYSHLTRDRRSRRSEMLTTFGVASLAALVGVLAGGLLLPRPSTTEPVPRAPEAVEERPDARPEEPRPERTPQPTSPAPASADAVKLPDGTRVSIPRNSMEESLFDYLSSDERAPSDFLVFEEVPFRGAEPAPRSRGLQQLDTVAALLLAFPDVQVEIGGHSDNQGKPESKVKTAEDRANAIVRLLTGRRVPPTQVTARGYSDERPIASNDTEDGRIRNRLATLRIVKR